MNFIDAKKNLNRQGTKVLHDIVDAFQRGVFDDPQKSAAYCGLLACICEGKVQGVFDEDTASIKWSLTPEYSKQLEALQAEILASASSAGKVVRGPW